MEIIDCHCDTLMLWNRDRLNGRDMHFDHNPYHVDISKLKKGNYQMQCFAAFVDVADSPVNPLVEALMEIDVFHLLMERHAGEIAPVLTYADLEQNRQAGRISAMLTIEDAGVTDGYLSGLRTLYRLGARMMTLTWNHENNLAYPNTPVHAEPGIDYQNAGLKPDGIAFVEEMNRLGIIIDVSHLSDGGFYDVARYSAKPFIASHSNARSLCGHLRNLSDEMLKVIAEKGGFTGMNYCIDFLDEDTERLKARGSAEAVVDHMVHIRKVAGVDVIALGSDFDGIPITLDVADASKMGLLIQAMERRGFTSTEIEKICCGNALRVFKEILH